MEQNRRNEIFTIPDFLSLLDCIWSVISRC